MPDTIATPTRELAYLGAIAGNNEAPENPATVKEELLNAIADRIGSAGGSINWIRSDEHLISGLKNSVSLGSMEGDPVFGAIAEDLAAGLSGEEIANRLFMVVDSIGWSAPAKYTRTLNRISIEARKLLTLSVSSALTPLFLSRTVNVNLTTPTGTVSVGTAATTLNESSITLSTVSGFDDIVYFYYLKK